jgi:hypothetical protein
METSTAVTAHKQFTNGNIHKLESPQDSSPKLWQELEPWPDPVGPEIIGDIESALQKHLFLSTETALTCTLWAGHADMFEEFEHTPRLGITAPFKGSGKTQLLTVLKLLTNHAVDGSLCTTAAFERLSAKARVSFFMDEADKVFKHGNNDLTKALNAGWETGEQYIKCSEKDNEPKGYPLYSAVALAGISLPQRLAEATLDRTIVVNMVKARPGQIADKYKRRKHKAKFHQLGRKLLRWTKDHQQQIADCEPVFPDSVDGRDEDKWFPLVAVASVASKELGKRAMGLVLGSSSVTELTGNDGKRRFLQSVVAVHESVRSTLQPNKHHGMSIRGIQPTQMAIELCNVHRNEDDDDRYWERYNAAKSSDYSKDEDMAIKAHQVTALFADFGVIKKSIKHPDGTVMDGHRWDDIIAVCDQYLSVDSAEYVPGEDRAEDHGRQVGTYPRLMEVQP